MTTDLGNSPEPQQGEDGGRSAGEDSGFAVPQLGPDDDALKAALRYAGGGIRVGPLRQGRKSPGDILGHGWPTKTTTDPNMIVAWFAGEDYGVFLHGIGLVIFDIDRPELVPAWLWEHLETAPMQRTRTGGDPRRGHYLFAAPPGRRLGNSLGKLPKGWGEIRGNGGVIVAAPTRHESKDGCYGWTRTGPVPVLPEAIAALLPDCDDPRDAVSTAEVSAFVAEHAEQGSAVLADSIIRTFEREAPAGRHDACVRAACWLTREAAAGRFPALPALKALRRAFLTAVGPDRDGRGEWERIVAYAVGQLTPGRVAAEISKHDTSGYELDGEDHGAVTRAADEGVPAAQEPAGDPGSIDDCWAPQGKAPARAGDGGTGGAGSGANGSAAAKEDARRLAVKLLREQMLSAREVIDRPDPVPIVAGLLYRNTLATLFGPFGSLKSFVALDLAAHVALGQEWCGRRTNRGGVLYLVAEGVDGFSKRMEAWTRAHDLREIPGLTILPRPVQVADADAWGTLVQVAIEDQYSLIIIDTRARISVGLEENSSTDTATLVHRCEALRDAAGGCVLMVHHSGWDGDHQRGSSAWPGAIDAELKCTKIGGPGAARAVLRSTKAKDDRDGEKIVLASSLIDLGREDELGSRVTSLVLHHVPDAGEDDEEEPGFGVHDVLHFTEVTTDLVTVMDDVARAGTNGLTRTQIAAFLSKGAGRHKRVRVGCSRATAYREINRLLELGWLARVGNTSRLVIQTEEKREEATARAVAEAGQD